MKEVHYGQANQGTAPGLPAAPPTPLGPPPASPNGAVVGGSTAAAAPSSTVPAAPVPEDRSAARGIPGLYITGLIVLGAAWLNGIAVTAAATSSDDPNRGGYLAASVVPVLGPWIIFAIGQNATPQYAFSSLDQAACITFGLLQGAGLVLTIVGFTAHREVGVQAPGIASFSLMPTLDGVTAIGAF